MVGAVTVFAAMPETMCAVGSTTQYPAAHFVAVGVAEFVFWGQ
jgi:hypothetical protein